MRGGGHLWICRLRDGTTTKMNAGPEPVPAVLQQHLYALCAELKAVVEDATTHGNEVVETWTGLPTA